MSRKIVSLNGLWNYEVNGKSMGYKQVPFSALCVGRSVCETEFVRPEGKRCFLCFEGITYAAEVFINAINEQIPKGNQKDRDISSLWW